MRKAIALLALLVIGLAPLALAEDDSVNVSANANANVSTGDTSTSAHAGANAAGRGKGSERTQDVREHGKEVKAVAKDLRTMKSETRGSMKSHVEELKAVAQSLKDCKGKKDDDCEQKRKGAKETAKNTLADAATDVTTLLTNAKARIAESNLTNKDTLTADIDAQLTAIASAKAKIDALNENSTKKDIQAATKDLRSAVQKARRSVRSDIHGIIANKLGNVLMVATNVATRLDKALAQLKAKGVDTSSVDLTQFKAKLNASMTASAQANALFQQARSADEGQKDELMKQATDKLRESHNDLKDAREELMKVLKALKALKGGDEAVEASTSTSASANATTTA